MQAHTLAHAHSIHLVIYTHAHKHTRTNVAAALTEPVLVTVNSAFAHSSELPGLVKVSGLCFELRANITFSEIEYCCLHTGPDNYPYTGTQGCSYSTSQIPALQKCYKTWFLFQCVHISFVSL